MSQRIKRIAINGNGNCDSQKEAAGRSSFIFSICIYYAMQNVQIEHPSLLCILYVARERVKLFVAVALVGP